MLCPGSRLFGVGGAEIDLTPAPEEEGVRKRVRRGNPDNDPALPKIRLGFELISAVDRDDR